MGQGILRFIRNFGFWGTLVGGFMFVGGLIQQDIVHITVGGVSAVLAFCWYCFWNMFIKKESVGASESTLRVKG